MEILFLASHRTNYVRGTPPRVQRVRLVRPQVDAKRDWSERVADVEAGLVGDGPPRREKRLLQRSTVAVVYRHAMGVEPAAEQPVHDPQPGDLVDEDVVVGGEHEPVAVAGEP